MQNPGSFSKLGYRKYDFFFHFVVIRGCLTVIPIDSHCPGSIRDRKPFPLPPGIFFYIVPPYLMTHDVLVHEHHVGEHVLTHLIRGLRGFGQLGPRAPATASCPS